VEAKDFFTPTELLREGIIPLGKNALYEALKRGDIFSHRIGKKLIIPRSEIDRLRAGRAGASGAQRENAPLST
jgi:hypothetical protein